ncbi:MAG: hypothetical protein KKH98_15915 [Spirochaetes bacterium]|nr:hypothetical protein [Spirochaetota bacterium]
MENNYQGKYFSFFNIRNNQTQLVKFRSRDEKYYSANTIWEQKIIPNILFELNYDDKNVSLVDPAVPDETIEILFLDETYYENEKIQFIVFNKDYISFDLSLIILDEENNISFHSDTAFQKTDQYKILRADLFHTGQYRIMFYVEHKFKFFTLLRIRKNDLAKYIIDQKKSKNKIKFSLFPQEYKDELEVNYTDLNNFTPAYNTVLTESEEEVEELYVPLSELFKKDIKDNEFQRFLKIKLENRYNAMGMVKIIDTIKAMKTKDEVLFMENLMKENSELALTLMEIIFDFDLLFLISFDESREILGGIDDYTVTVALKGETKNRIEQIRSFLPDKRWEKIEKLFSEFETIELEETDKAQKKIGTIIRSYFQVKFGIPFVFEKKKISKYKIKNFKLTPDYEFRVPEFIYNGSYLMEFKLKNEQIVNMIHKVSSGKKENKFYIKRLFSTGDFFKIIHVDNEYLQIKFNEYMKTSVLLFVNKESIQMEETHRIYEDEIIQFKMPRTDRIHLIIGAINDDKERKAYEAEIVVSLYKTEDDKIFMPDSIISNDDIPLKVMDEKDSFLYTHQKEIPLSVHYERWRDLLEVEDKRSIELTAPEEQVDIFQTSGITSLPGHVHNNLDRLSIFYADGDKLSAQTGSLVSILPVIVRYKGNVLTCYNLTEKEFSVEVFSDNEKSVEQKSDQKFLELLNISNDKRIKVQIKTVFGDLIYHFSLFRPLKEFAFKGKYIIKDEDKDHILNAVYWEKERSIFHLVMQLKSYFFQYQKTKKRIYENMLRLVMEKMNKECFNKQYFIYDKKAGFNILDIVEVLLHLKEIFNKGLNQLDEMIRTNLAYLKKVKMKDKRLKDYLPKKKLKIF